MPLYRWAGPRRRQPARGGKREKINASARRESWGRENSERLIITGVRRPTPSLSLSFSLRNVMHRRRTVEFQRANAAPAVPMKME